MAASAGSTPRIVHDASGTTNRYRRRLPELAGNRGRPAWRLLLFLRDSNSKASSRLTAGTAPRTARTASNGRTTATSEGVSGTRGHSPLAPHRGRT